MAYDNLTDAEEAALLKQALRPFGMLMLNVYTDATLDTPVQVKFVYDGIDFTFDLKYRDFVLARDPMNPDNPAR